MNEAPEAHATFDCLNPHISSGMNASNNNEAQRNEQKSPWNRGPPILAHTCACQRSGVHPLTRKPACGRAAFTYALLAARGRTPPLPMGRSFREHRLRRSASGDRHAGNSRRRFAQYRRNQNAKHSVQSIRRGGESRSIHTERADINGFPDRSALRELQAAPPVPEGSHAKRLSGERLQSTATPKPQAERADRRTLLIRGHAKKPVLPQLRLPSPPMPPGTRGWGDALPCGGMSRCRNRRAGATGCRGCRPRVGEHDLERVRPDGGGAEISNLVNAASTRRAVGLNVWAACLESLGGR